MPKAILEFELEDLDDKMAHLRCIKSTDMASALFDIMHNTKKSCKNVVECMLDNKETCTPYEAIDVVFERIYEILEDNNIKLDELIN